MPGKRPVPFRTRKLSLVTLMVLHSRERGRVRNRRHSNLKTNGAPNKWSPVPTPPKENKVVKAEVQNPFLQIGGGAAAYRDVRPSYPADIISQLPLSSHTPVADIGAGTGKLTAQLCQISDSVWAVEPAKEFRKIFRQELPDFPNSRLVSATAENTGFDSATFSLLTYAQCWHWLDAEKAAQEAARILTPGGAVAIVYNQFDVSIPWVLQLSRIMRSGDVHRFDKPPKLGKDFSPPQLERSYWIDTLRVPELFALGTTRSSWIKSSAENRQKMRENLRWYICEELGIDFAAGIIRLPYHTLLWTAYKQ